MKIKLAICLIMCLLFVSCSRLSKVTKPVTTSINKLFSNRMEGTVTLNTGETIVFDLPPGSKVTIGKAKIETTETKGWLGTITGPVSKFLKQLIKVVY